MLYIFYLVKKFKHQISIHTGWILASCHNAVCSCSMPYADWKGADTQVQSHCAL